MYRLSELLGFVDLYTVLHGICTVCGWAAGDGHKPRRGRPGSGGDAASGSFSRNFSCLASRQQDVPESRRLENNVLKTASDPGAGPCQVYNDSRLSTQVHTAATHALGQPGSAAISCVRWNVCHAVSTRELLACFNVIEDD